MNGRNSLRLAESPAGRPGRRWASRTRVDGRSVHFDDAVDLPSEPEASEKPDGSCEQKETKDHDTSVTEVEECRSAPRNLQLGDKIVNTIYGQVESREATCKKASPPPVIILCAQMKVAEEDGGLGTSYHQNQKHQE